MTPREKASDLVGKMYQSAEWSKEEDYNPLQQYQRVKQYALIAVNEIIEIAYWPYVKKYWKQVKKEIENL